MEHSEPRELPLSVNFARAQSQLKSINSTSLASSSEEYQKQAQALVLLLKTCSSQIDRLSLFSSNETTEDYSTSELKLILVGAYLGEALQKLSAPEGRAEILSDALEQYKSFLSVCQTLGIATQNKDVERILENQGKGSGKSSGVKASPADAGLSRMQKIERFKRTRAMQQEIAEMETRLAGKPGASSNSDVDEQELDMEEIEREYAVKLIELKIYQVIDDIDMLYSEIEMAKQMEQMKLRASDSGGQAKDKQATASDEKEWRLDSQSYKIDPRTGKPIVPIFNDKGQPMRPFVLTSDRQRIKDSVFRPDWALPTMSVDEYLKQEEERGNIISGGGKEPDEKPDIDDNDYEALDADTMKKREWDDFKDDNPRGAGNRGGNRG
ncbi:Type 2A phosphatase-associated protein 42 [Coemansia sp. RSA 486]|nr:Type 2A phosphatase-associated protein 42 [Coemansia sp. RSA 486]KAJ2602304.1 Type 2A phosphatase-associated protein 42 [Coemansia sp. RSA 1721]KAJ2640464.1 Type 2A phosphatase-associated protein 42 [Coemansia sp. RSA 1286]